MPLRTQTLSHDHDGTRLDAYVAFPDTDTPAPGVMIFSDWSGLGPHAKEVADRLAGLGYVGFAADMYGASKRGQSVAENTALMNGVAGDRTFLQARLKAVYEACAGLDAVDAKNIAASGYCFGGLCALDVARSNIPVRGVTAFHAILGAPGNTSGHDIKPKVLALHGWDDPMAKPEDVNAFADEMTTQNADWQLHAYGQTVHAFTNKQANDPDFGTVYNAAADARSWQAFISFLAELFA